MFIPEREHGKLAAAMRIASRSINLGGSDKGRSGMIPFNINFNIACNTMARKLWPLGYSISGIDTSEAAPATFAELKARLDAGKRHIVDGASSDNTIFACPETNCAFRAWHDWCHYRGGHDFTLNGEAKVARMQCEHVRLLYGNGASFERFAKLILCEVIGQAAYYAANGRFPADQRAFTRQALPEYRHIVD